jgi:hypothetical protein
VVAGELPGPETCVRLVAYQCREASSSRGCDSPLMFFRPKMRLARTLQNRGGKGGKSV